MCLGLSESVGTMERDVEEQLKTTLMYDDKEKVLK